jgi:hypothetical protein
MELKMENGKLNTPPNSASPYGIENGKYRTTPRLRMELKMENGKWKIPPNSASPYGIENGKWKMENTAQLRVSVPPHETLCAACYWLAQRTQRPQSCFMVLID